MNAFIKLTSAMEIFSDETLQLSFAERLNIIRQALITYTADHLGKVAAEGNKHKVSDNEEYVVKQFHKHLKTMEQLHNAQIKANKALGKNATDTDMDWLKAIKDSKSSIGSIFQDLKEKIPHLSVATG